MSTNSTQNKKKRHITPGSSLVTLSSYFVASMTILSYLGYHLDGYMQNKHYYFTFVGAMVGFISSMYETIKTVKLIEKSEKKSTKE